MKRDRTTLIKWKIKIISSLKRVLLVVFASAIYSFSYHNFIVPFGLLGGGISGISIMVDYLTPISYISAMIILNIPILIWGLKELDKKYILSNIMGISITLMMIHLTGPFVPSLHIDIFLAAIASGIFSGIYVGLLFRAQISGGGTDTIGSILKKKKNISMGTTTFVFNLSVLSVSLFFFDIKIAMYTMISIWISSRMTDSVIDGLNKNKSVMIISDKSNKIAARIIRELQRGVTFFHGEGAYSSNDKRVINCVVTHFEIVKIKSIVFEEDARAFMYYVQTVEVEGRGFENTVFTFHKQRKRPT